MPIEVSELKQFLEEKIQEAERIIDQLNAQSSGFFKWIGKAMAFKEVLDYITIKETE